MSRSFPLLVVFAAGLSAQFNQLVTTGDGTQVVFSSNLSLKAEPAHNWPKLYEATTGGVHLVEERFPAPPPVFLPSLEAFYQLLARDQSSDGSVLALNTYRPCIGGSRCVFVERFIGELSVPSRAEPFQRGGLLRVSSNGRYALSYGSTGPMPLTAILDVPTTTVTPIPQIRGTVAPPGRRVISDNGTAVYVKTYADGAVVLVSREGVETTAKTAMPASSAIIDAEGRFVVYESASSPPQLNLYDLTEGWEFSLVWAEEGCTQPALSDDGRLMLFLSAANWEAANNELRPQAWLLDLFTGELRQMTQDPAGIVEATLSGDGQAAWAVTLAGRLLRIETSSRTVEEIVGRTAALDYDYASCVPGSECSLTGRGLAHGVFASSAPLPLTLGGIEFKVAGVPVPLVSVAPDRIQFLLSWDFQPGQYPSEVTQGDSIFQEKNVLVLYVTPPTSPAN